MVALLGGLSTLVCKTAATIYRVPLTSKQLDELTTLTRSEKDMLEALAPYAAEYAPELMGKVKPVLAWAFVGVYGLAVGTRVWDIREQSPKQRAKRRELELRAEAEARADAGIQAERGES